MKLALLQLTSGTNPDENYDAVASLVETTDASFVLTPEMTPLLQKDSAALQAAVRSERETVEPYAALAKQKHIHLLVGSAAVRREDGAVANRSLLINPDGAVIARYDKINLFEANLSGGESYRESDTYAAGEAPVITVVDQLRLGLSVCYDVRFPALYSDYGMEQVDMISVPSAFTRSTGKAHWEILLRARAIETGAYILAPAQGGHHADGRKTWGRTMAISPWGEVVGCLDHDKPGCLEVEINQKAVEDARARIPAWRQR